MSARPLHGAGRLARVRAGLRALAGRAACTGSIGLVALGLAAAPAAQNAARGSELQLRHLAAVRAERAARFRAEWLAADEPHRAAARAALERLTNRAGPINAPPTPADVAAATRVLEGADPDTVRTDLLAHVADALDLEVVPGAFDAAGEGRGTPLTVRVYPLESSHPLGEVRLHLLWIAPDGTETRVRSQTVLPAALRAPGFDLYVRAPLSAPATWELAAEIELDGRTVRSPAVPVECVTDWAQRSGAGFPAGPAAFAARLADLNRYGVRTEVGLSPPALLRVLERLARGEPLAAPVPLPASLPGEGELPALLALRPAGEVRRTLLLLAPAGETPGVAFEGPTGERWRGLAARTGALLLSASFDDDVAGRSLAERLRVARALEPDVPLVVVARGDAETRLRLALFRDGDGELDLAGRLAGCDLVLVTNAAGAQPPVASARILIVEPGAKESPEPDDRGVSRHPGAGSVFLTELELPGIVERWLGP